MRSSFERARSLTSCIVCCHLLRATDIVLGFVEDNDPDDPLTCCNDCERLYAHEQDWTEAFRAFADPKVVCDGRYALLKELHSVGTIERGKPT